MLNFRMYGFLLKICFYQCSQYLNSNIESVTDEMVEKLYLEKRRSDFVSFESVLLLIRLDMILDFFKLAEDEEENKEYLTKISRRKIHTDDKNLIPGNIEAKWAYSAFLKPFLINKKIYKQNIKSKEFSLNPKFHEYSDDIQHLYRMVENIENIIINANLTFSQRFKKCKIIISRELKDQGWNDIKSCKLFIGHDHILGAISNNCLCKNCYGHIFKEYQKSQSIWKTEIWDVNLFRNKKRPFHDYFKDELTEKNINYFIQYFRDYENNIYLTDEMKEALIKNPKFYTGNSTKILQIFYNFCFSLNSKIQDNNPKIDNDDPTFIKNLISSYYYVYCCTWDFVLMLFMKSPFGFWQPLGNTKPKNHEFVDDSYEILIKNKYFENYNIYRKLNKEDYKYIAVRKDAKVKKCFKWGNGVIISRETNIDENVEIGEHTYLGDEVQVSKNVKIGKGCTIFNYNNIRENSNVDDNITVPGYTII